MICACIVRIFSSSFSSGTWEVSRAVSGAVAHSKESISTERPPWTASGVVVAVSRVPITVNDSPNSFKLAAESKLVVGYEVHDDDATSRGTRLE